MDQYKIKIRPESTWTTFSFESNNGKTRLLASNFMTPIEDLLYSVRMLLKGISETEVSLIDEPGEYIIGLEKRNKVLEVKIYSFPDFKGENRNRKYGTIILACSFSFNKFLNQIINSLYYYPHNNKIEILMNEIIELRKIDYNNN